MCVDCCGPCWWITSVEYWSYSMCEVLFGSGHLGITSKSKVTLESPTQTFWFSSNFPFPLHVCPKSYWPKIAIIEVLFLEQYCSQCWFPIDLMIPGLYCIEELLCTYFYFFWIANFSTLSQVFAMYGVYVDWKLWIWNCFYWSDIAKEICFSSWVDCVSKSYFYFVNREFLDHITSIRHVLRVCWPKMMNLDMFLLERYC